MSDEANKPQEALLKHAREVRAKIQEALSKTDPGLSSVREARDLATRHSALIGITEQLHEDKGHVSAMKRLRDMFPNEFKNALTPEKELAHARWVAQEQLEKMTPEVSATLERHAASWHKERPAVKTAAAAKEAAEEQSPGLIRRMFGKGSIGTALEEHERKMMERSKGERMGISVAQVGLGFVGINVGARMLQEAGQGLKRKKVFVQDESGRPQLAAITAVSIGGGERLIKGTAGMLITAAGIGSLLLGTTNFGKSM